MKARDYARATTWKAHRISYHKFMYEDYIKRFEGHADDRQIFINVYNMILAALEEMEEEPNNYIAVAMNKAMTKDYDMLDEIIERFKNK